ncbi:MAG: DNA-binding protein [Moorea sp. SIO3C2]|nr:DNA-binding protein [Moorena sp. SIO3C2]
MIVGTTQAASLLGISSQRLRMLLSKDRIKGAKKVGRFWQIPLYDGVPVVTEGRRGPKGTWNQDKNLDATYIHVNEQALKSNQKNQTSLPVFTVKRGERTHYCHEVEISGACRLVYRPLQAESMSDSVWLQVEPNVPVTTKVFTGSENLDDKLEESQDSLNTTVHEVS